MDKATLEKMATTAFENIKANRAELFTATEKALFHKVTLETEEASAMAGGQFDGKNAETRKAQAREFFNDKYMELATAENGERSARYHYDLAQLDVETVKTLLRIAELTD